MSALKTYRCWTVSGSARLVNQSGHREAAEEAQELNHLASFDLGRGSPEYKKNVFVVKTECLQDGTITKWKGPS